MHAACCTPWLRPLTFSPHLLRSWKKSIHPADSPMRWDALASVQNSDPLPIKVGQQSDCKSYNKETETCFNTTMVCNTVVVTVRMICGMMSWPSYNSIDHVHVKPDSVTVPVFKQYWSCNQCLCITDLKYCLWTSETEKSYCNLTRLDPWTPTSNYTEQTYKCITVFLHHC